MPELHEAQVLPDHPQVFAPVRCFRASLQSADVKGITSAQQVTVEKKERQKLCRAGRR